MLVKGGPGGRLNIKMSSYHLIFNMGNPIPWKDGLFIEMGPGHNTNFSTPPMDSQSHIFFQQNHDDVIKWKHIPRYWPFVQGIHRSPANSPHKGQWCGALMFSLIMCARTNGWVNNRDAGDLRRHCAHYDIIVLNAGAKMLKWISLLSKFCWSLSRISESQMRKLLQFELYLLQRIFIFSKMTIQCLMLRSDLNGAIIYRSS